MTEAVILRKIPGHARGEITELTERIAKHVQAGNARVLPNEHEDWRDTAPDPEPIQTHSVSSTGTGAVADDEDLPECAEDELPGDEEE